MPSVPRRERAPDSRYKVCSHHPQPFRSGKGALRLENNLQCEFQPTYTHTRAYARARAHTHTHTHTHTQPLCSLVAKDQLWIMFFMERAVSRCTNSVC